MPASLRLVDFLDEEFLALVIDNAGYEGWASSREIAEAIDPDAETITTRHVGSRLAWMRRYGVVERDPRPGSPTKGYWRLTEAGEALVKARFSKTQQTALSSVKDEQLWLLSAELGLRYEGVNYATANLVRRRFIAAQKRRL